MSKKVNRTSDNLKELMWDELEALTAGTSTPQNARAKASLAGQICGITRLEIDFSRFVAEKRTEGGKLANIPMGVLE